MGIFLISFLVLFAIVTLSVGIGLKFLESQRQQKVEAVLRTVDVEAGGARRRVVIKKQGRDEGVEGLLESMGAFESAHQLIQQAGVKWSVGSFLAFSAVLCIVGAFFGYNVPVFVFRVPSAIAAAAFFGALPYFYLSYQRKKRMAEFEEQFPEALEFLARSMRAGHAFTVSMGMAGDDTPDPLGTEFRQSYNEQNLGASVEEVMKNLSKRVPLIDVRFFVSAVLMQREVGGNLAEILDSLAEVIRERFRIKGHVRAVSAHGRLTATILVILPIALMLGLMLVAPSYLQMLADDEHGQYLIVYAIVAQLVGFYFIRRIVRIKI